jgi:hypothetical protein
MGSLGLGTWESVASGAPLAAAQVVGRAIVHVIEFELCQHRPGSRAGLRRRHPVIQQTEGDVLEHRGEEQLVVRVLEHEAHAAPHHPQGIAFGHQRSAHPDRPRHGNQQAVEVL